MIIKKHKNISNILCILGTAFLLVSYGHEVCAADGSLPSGGPAPQTGSAAAPVSQEAAHLPDSGQKTASLSEIGGLNAMCAPNGIAYMGDDVLLVTDTYNKRLWMVYAGMSQIYAGGDTVPDLHGEPMGGYNDADRLSSHFASPWAVTKFLDGYAVSDTGNNVVRLVRSQGVETVNGRTSENLAVSSTGVTFDRPTGLASDNEGNLYISDTGAGAIRKVSTDGIVTTVAIGLNEPMGLCWKNGILYAAETGANRIVTVDNGLVTPLAGNGEADMADGPALLASFDGPRGLDVSDDGTVYVSDTLNSAIRRIRNGQVDTVVARDTANTDLGLISPAGLLVQGERLYICDSFSRKLFVLEWK